jgi:hypothetical protein
MRFSLIFLLAAALCFGGCAQRSDRYGAVGTLPTGVSSASVKLVRSAHAVQLVVHLKGKPSRWKGHEMVALCKQAHYDGAGRSSDGGSAQISGAGQVKIAVGQGAFAAALWQSGGTCSVLIGGTSDVPTSVSFGAA